MDAWRTSGDGRLALGRVASPEAGRGEILIRTLACGVCRTDIHVVRGEIPPRRRPVIPGHQIVGEVVARGAGATRFAVGERVGVAWLASTCGRCDWCLTGRENLCPGATFTGWDRDGGFAPVTSANEDYAYPLPASVDPLQLAPLLCAGIIGYRALSRAQLPPGGRLGLYGFGSSASITAQFAAADGAIVSAMTRGEDNRSLARALGADFVGAERARPPAPLDSAIVFAPAGSLIPVALEALRPGGTLVLAGIHMDAIPPLDYERHLFHEKDVRTVTANTRADGEAFLRLAAQLPITAHVTPHRFADTDRALDDLAAGRASGSLVIDFTRG